MTTSPSPAWIPASSTRVTSDTFKGKDGKIYGLPKDGNTIALAYASDLVTAAPTTMDELVTTAEGLKGNTALKAPMCLNPGLDRGLAFIYAQGGELLNADETASAIETDASKAAVQWYLDLFKNGLGDDAGRARSRLVRRGARDQEGRDDLRGRLARPGDDRHLPRRQVRMGGDAGRLLGEPRDDRVHGQLFDRRRLGQQGPGIRVADLPRRGGRHDQVDHRAASRFRRARTCRTRPARRS